MADRQLKLYAQTTYGGTKTTTTTISNVNPQADSATMKTFAQKLNAFTTNTYQKTDLVETTNVDTETVKIPTTIEFQSTTATVTAEGIPLNIKKSTGGNVFGTAFLIGSSPAEYYAVKQTSGSSFSITSTKAGQYDVRVALLETSTEMAATAQATITASAS